MRGIFVTGTDTNVGKTVVSAALAAHFPRAHYWKPIQTGIEIDDDAAEVERLTQSQKSTLAPLVRLPGPVSPHLAAKRAGIRIDLDSLTHDSLTQWTVHNDDAWIVEGAGGVLVPINEDETMAKLMLMLALPVVVVARSTLGTINHTLLTLEALRSRSLYVAGVVMSGHPDAENRAAIEHYGRVRVAELPWFDPLTSASLTAWSAPSWVEEYFA